MREITVQIIVPEPFGRIKNLIKTTAITGSFIATFYFASLFRGKSIRQKAR
ncbi:hypothetical protein ACOJCD_002203 [Cronobacter dublinensis]